MRRAAFLDRDGVLNEDRGFVHQRADFHFIPGAVAALRALQQAGFLLVVVTNQSGIGRGLFTEADYQVLDEYLRTQLAAQGVRLDAVEYCPHAPDADCECRKPRPGMILAAASRLGIDLPCSILVGDRRADVEAGRAAGVGQCFLVTSGKPLSAADRALADATYADLGQCVEQLLRNVD